MSMFSEIATEATILLFVQEIKKELDVNEGNQEVCNALKRIGRFALTQFEWDAPEWAPAYQKYFAE